MKKLFTFATLSILLISSTLAATTNWKGPEDWDNLLLSNGVAHEAVSHTDHSNESNIRKGYTVSRASSNLEAYLRFDQNVAGTGGTAVDSSGNNNDGVYKNVTTGVKGLLGTDAAKFDGDTSYIPLGNLVYDTQGGISEITVCAWVKSSKGTNKYGNFIASYDRSEYWRLAFEDDVNTHIGWDTTDSTGKTHDLGTPSGYADGNWHYICGWFKAGASPDKKIFVDGQVVASATAHNGHNLGTGTTRYGFIGAGSEASSFDGQQGQGNNPEFKGKIEDFRIYNKALSLSKVQNLYEVAKKPSNFTTSYKSFSKQINTSTLRLEGLKYDLNGGSIDLVVSSDNGYTSDQITLDGSTSYEVTGLSGVADKFRLEVDVSSPTVSDTPVLKKAVLSGKPYNVTFTWSDDSSKEKGFRIYNNASPNTDKFVKVAEVDKNKEKIVHSGGFLQPGKYVCYRAKAFNSVGLSGYTEACTTLSK
ncbi:MAG: LamG domain-containing protein [Candidatus Nanohalobium sp.]